jgi:hypothetical protein
MKSTETAKGHSKKLVRPTNDEDLYQYFQQRHELRKMKRKERELTAAAAGIVLEKPPEVVSECTRKLNSEAKEKLIEKLIEQKKINIQEQKALKEKKREELKEMMERERRERKERVNETVKPPKWSRKNPPSPQEFIAYVMYLRAVRAEEMDKSISQEAINSSSVATDGLQLKTKCAEHSEPEPSSARGKAIKKDMKKKNVNTMSTEVSVRIIRRKKEKNFRTPPKEELKVSDTSFAQGGGSSKTDESRDVDIATPVKAGGAVRKSDGEVNLAFTKFNILIALIQNYS